MDWNPAPNPVGGGFRKMGKGESLFILSTTPVNSPPNREQQSKCPVLGWMEPYAETLLLIAGDALQRLVVCIYLEV